MGEDEPDGPERKDESEGPDQEDEPEGSEQEDKSKKPKQEDEFSSSTGKTHEQKTDLVEGKKVSLEEPDEMTVKHQKSMKFLFHNAELDIEEDEQFMVEGMSADEIKEVLRAAAIEKYQKENQEPPKAFDAVNVLKSVFLPFS